MKRELVIAIILAITLLLVKEFLLNSQYIDLQQVFIGKNDNNIDFIPILNFAEVVFETDQGPTSGIFWTILPTSTISINDIINKHKNSNTIISKPEKIEWIQEFQRVTIDLKLIQNKSNVHVVETRSNSSFLDRIEDFCRSISRERHKIISIRGLKPWEDVHKPAKLKVLWGRNDDFFMKLTSEENLRFVLLPWITNSSRKDGNIIIKDYYRWTSSNTLCEWIRTPRFTKAHYDAVFNRSCEENIRASKQSSLLKPFYFHFKPINTVHYWPNDGLSYPSHFHTQYPSVPLYLTIVQNGIVNIIGDVITGGTKIVPFTCSNDNLPTIPNEYMESRIYKEVFVITQFWGDAFFHRLIEVMPRLAPYLSFLKRHPTIKIHAPTDKGSFRDMMTMLGLNPERIVVGVIRVKIIYLPQSTYCGFPNVQGLQLLSYHFKSYMKNKINDPNNLQEPRMTRNKLVWISRSGLRRLLHDRETEYLLRNFSRKYNLDFHLFSDKSLPGLIETMRIFNSAQVVVAPHGAGLSNVVFSEPGTLVVEGVCNPPHVNLCYQHVASVLGLRYHGMPSLSGCESYINIEPQNFVDTLEQFFSA